MKSLPDLKDEKIPDGVLGFLRSRARNSFHQVVLREFSKLSNEKGLSKNLIAKRLGKDPAQINRWLGSPGNWTIETFADLLTAMGCTAIVESSEIGSEIEPNYCHPDYDSAFAIVSKPNVVGYVIGSKVDSDENVNVAVQVRNINFNISHAMAVS